MSTQTSTRYSWFARMRKMNATGMIWSSTSAARASCLDANRCTKRAMSRTRRQTGAEADDVGRLLARYAERAREAQAARTADRVILVEPAHARARPESPPLRRDPARHRLEGQARGERRVETGVGILAREPGEDDGRRGDEEADRPDEAVARGQHASRIRRRRRPSVRRA